VARTGDIGLVSITGESAVAAGVRRVEAKTADAARHQLNEEAQRLRELALLIKASAEDAPARLSALLEERKRLERELTDARKKLAMGGSSSGNGADQAVRDVAGVKLFARAVQGVEMKDLKSLADEAKKTLGSGIVAIANTAADGKGAIVVSVTPDLTERFNAVDFVRLASERLGGKGGGGRPDMAQAGGPDGSQVEAALQAVEDALRARVAG
jgi:alanyl-tRNA synthetase